MFNTVNVPVQAGQMKNYGFKSCSNWLTIFIRELRPDMKTLIAADNAII
jgi:hypothetical protein